VRPALFAATVLVAVLVSLPYGVSEAVRNGVIVTLVSLAYVVLRKRYAPDGENPERDSPRLTRIWLALIVGAALTAFVVVSVSANLAAAVSFLSFVAVFSVVMLGLGLFLRHRTQRG
jgi:hypothetical protein